MSRTLKTSLVLFGMLVLAGAFMVVFMVSPAMAQTATATPAPTATPIPFTAQVAPVAMYPSMGAVDPKTSRPTGVNAPRGDDPTKSYAVFGPGHTNVPLGVPVYVQASAIGMAQGAKLTAYDWTLKAPTGSKATMTKVTQAVPGLTLDMANFTPDVDGTYEVSAIVTDSAGKKSAAGTLTFTTAKYVGNTVCAGCHKTEGDGWATTKHATAFERFVDENAEGEYFSAGFGCARCHTVGYYPVAASTGGWWDVFTNVLKLNWTKSPLTITYKTTDPTTKKETENTLKFNSLSEAIALNAFNETEGANTFSGLDPKLQAVSNIGCESCHGPGSAHVLSAPADKKATAPVASADSSSCIQCHAASGHHTRGNAVMASAHEENASLAEGDRKPCNACHSPEGAVDVMNGVAADKQRAENGNIGCATCHDPHGDKNVFQLRMVDNVKLPTTDVKDAGLSAVCMECHNNRTNPNDPKTGVTSDNPSYPHYSSAAEMINGVGGYDWGYKLQNDFHSQIGKGVINDEHSNQPGNMDFTQINGGQAPGACVQCHMYVTPGGVWDTADSMKVPGHQVIGGHTFNMAAEVNGKEVQNTAACQSCHPGMTDFNLKGAADYDGNGQIQGVQDEIKGLLDKTLAAIQAKAKAEGYTITTTDAAGKPLSYPYMQFSKGAKPSTEVKAAIYNFRYVMGVMWTGQGQAAAIHNFKRSAGLLQLSIEKLSGKPLPNATLLYSK